MPTLITLPGVPQDGSKKRQFVHLTANQETSVKSRVATEVNETSTEDLAQRNSKDKVNPDQKKMGNSLHPQSSASHTEEMPKSTMYQNAFPGDITAQNDQTWLSKSTNQAFSYIRKENVTREAIGTRIEGNTSSISAYCIATSGSLTSKEINTLNNETRSSEPKEDVHRHTSVNHTSRPTAKTPIAVKPNSASVHCYPSLGSVASKETTTRRDEVLVQNEAFHKLSSTASAITTVPSIFNDGIERGRSASQLPKNPMKLQDAFGDKTNSTSLLPPPNKYKKPNVTRSVPHLIKDGFCNRKDGLHDTPSRHASTMKIFLTVDDPVRPASDSGPFSIRRLLSTQRPSQKSQVTNASACFPSHQQCDLNKHGHPPGTPSGNPSSLNGGIVRDSSPVKPRSASDSFVIQNMHIRTESSQVTNTPSTLSSLQGCGQSPSTVPTSSSFISSRDFTAGRHNSNSLIAPSNGKSLGQEHFGVKGAPLQTSPSNFSKSFYERNEPHQNVGPSNGSSAEKICTNNSSRQNPSYTHERKSKPLFHPGAIKVADKTPQSRTLPVATVQAMTTLSSSLHVGSSVPSRERLNTSHNHSEPPGNRSYSTEKTRNAQQWRHKDHKIQTRHKSYDVEALDLPGSTSSLLTPSTTSENSDLRTFVSYLTEPERPQTISAIKEQELETSFDTGQDGQLLESRTYCDSVQTQQSEIFQNQSRRVWTLQSDCNWVSDDPNRMGMNNAPDIYMRVTDRDILPNHDDNVLQNLPYFPGCHSPVDKQYTPVGYTSSTAHLSSSHLQHYPIRQMKELQLSHPRKRKLLSPYRQFNLT